jgi:tetratricopeptide (TPR) repeat protein
MAATRSQLRSWLLRVAATALGAVLLCAPAKAQRIVANPEYDALFAQVLREPANLDLSFRFAEIATAAGDYEAAIGALERMLFYNPALPRVRLELGILYFRLGSYETARSYFQGALAGSDVPPEVRARVEPFLFEIDRRLATTQWSGFGQLGLRFQTNANAGPTNSLVRGAGLDVILDRRFVKQPDWNLFGLAACRRAPHPRLRQPARRRLGDEPRRLRGAPVQDRAARSRARRDPDRAASRAHARPVGRRLD